MYIVLSFGMGLMLSLDYIWPSKYDIIIVACDCSCSLQRGGCCYTGFVGDVVAHGRTETVEPSDSIDASDRRAATAIPFQCMNAALPIYMYISFIMPFGILPCLTTACSCQK